MDVAVIGGGASGALVVTHLGAAGFPGRVFWIAGEQPLAGGLAYGRPQPWHLLNVPAGRMSAFPSDPADFARWLAARDGSPPDAFAPRALYRDYLAQTLERHRPESLVVVEDRVTAVHRLGRDFDVVLASGRRRRFDAVVLALGHQRPRPLPRISGHPRAVDDPWRTPVPHAEGLVVLVGTGLTMADVALTIARESPDARMIAFSRHGLAPLSHVAAPPSATDIPPMPLRALVRRVREEIRTGELPWQSVVDALRPHVPELWAALDPGDRARFLRHVRRYWDVHRHRLAPEVARELETLRASGRLDVARGRLADVQELRTGLRLTLATANGPRQVDAAMVVNCTGPTGDFARSSDPLVRQLVDSGLVSVDPLGLGLRARPDGTLLDVGGAPVTGLFTLGPPLSGVRWETTAIPEIRSQAAALARHLASVASPAARSFGTLPPA